MSSYLDESSQLAAYVAAVQVGSQTAFAAVYEREAQAYWAALPCAMVLPKATGSTEGEYGTVTNETHHLWDVKILYPWEDTDACTTAFYTLLDATLTALRASSSVNFGGRTSYAVIGPQDFGYLSGQSDTPDIRTATITIHARDLVTRTPTP